MTRRSEDPLLSAGDKAARGEMHNTLRQLVKWFGYSLVKSELLLVKREDENDRDSALRNHATQNQLTSPRDFHGGNAVRDEEHYDKLLTVWLAVEEVRRTSEPIATARAAAERLASTGGIATFSSANHLIRIQWALSHLRTAATIEREWKRAEAMRKGDPTIDYAWQVFLADLLGRPRPADDGLPWRSVPRGKTVEK